MVFVKERLSTGNYVPATITQIKLDYTDFYRRVLISGICFLIGVIINKDFLRALKRLMEFKVFDLGLVDFKEAWQFQKEIFSDVKAGLIKSALILCQHYPVITLGRKAVKENVRVSEYELKNRGIQIYEIERGGDVTYHGPGQLVIYPIFNLNYLGRDIHIFLRRLEEVVIDLLSDFGIKASRFSGLTGVWVNKQKIASIGIAIRNWITFHGLSINIKKNDLDNFRLIKPCGMDIEMIALETILGRNIEIDNLKENLIYKFKDIFPFKESESVTIKEEFDGQSSLARVR